MCEKVYQSARCWEFSDLTTTPCHNLRYPHLQMSMRPISHSTNPASAMIAMIAAAYAPHRARASGMSKGEGLCDAIGRHAIEVLRVLHGILLGRVNGAVPM